MKHNFVLTSFLVMLLLLMLSSGRYIWVLSRTPFRRNTSVEIVKTAAVSRGSVERKNTVVLQTVPSQESMAYLENDNSIHEEYVDLRLLTFNIRHGVDDEGKESLDSVIESIRETGAHIIALQEVDVFMPRSGFKNQAKEIADALGYYYVYGETINLLGVKYGNAILSAYPIIDHENKKLFSKEIETRGLLKAIIDVDGILHNVYTTHLGLNSEERIRQVEEINEAMANDSDHVILMGDFNEEPNSMVMAKISDRLVDSAEYFDGEEQYTYAFYSDEPNTRIDRIYVDQSFEVEGHYVIKSETSDHCMVVTTIARLNEKKEGITTFIENNK